MHTRFYEGTMRGSYALSFTKKVGKWLEASLNYSIINKTYNNYGLGIAFTGNAMQYFLISDNVSGIFLPQNANNINLRFGFNFIFGK